MTTTRPDPRAWLLCLTTAAMPVLAGCHLIFPYEDAVCERYVCTADVHRCATTNKSTKVAVLTTYSGPVGCFKWHPPATPANPADGYWGGQKAYCDRPWVIKNVGAPTLRGAGWISLPAAMSTSPGIHGGVKFRLDTDVENVYIAYDRRAKSLPAWLVDPTKWTRYTDLGAYIVITKPDKLNNTTETKLELYRATKVPKKGETFEVPGNLHGAPIWPTGFSTSEAAMYHIIVEAKKTYDCSKPTKANKVNTAKLVHCGDQAVTGCAGVCCTKAEVETQAAKTAIDDHLPNTYTTANVSCAKLQGCPDAQVVFRKTGLTVAPYGFPRSSEIEFDPAKATSKATVTIVGQTFTPNVKGILDFEYLLDEHDRMLTMKINGMSLYIDPLSTDAGTFSNIVVALMAPANAQCQDSPAPVASPCTDYQVATNEFIAALAADHPDGTLIAAAQNSGDIKVNIDHTTRTFTIKGGPLAATVNVNDEDRPIEISIDLTGKFLNFAPNARGYESQTVSECEENKNSEEIKLDASASFEIYGDAMPTAADSYYWFENYAQVGEKLWGTGKQVTIGTYQLDFGIHEFTLVVTDAGGISDADTFDVEVRDTVPPTLTVPQDRIRFVFAPETPPALVDVGEGSASDACSDDVMVTNDAPADSKFPEGTTTVLWEADDGRGNITTKTQAVTVVVFGDPNRPHVIEGFADLVVAINKAKDAAADCPPDGPCMVDLSVIGAMIELRDGLAGGEEDPDRIAEWADLIGPLDAAIGSLHEAEDLLRRADEEGAESAQLRGGAVERLDAASAAIAEVAGISDGTDPRAGGDQIPTFPPLPCPITIAAQGTFLAADLNLLRRFRDKRLNATAPGRWLVARYYQHAPALSRLLTAHTWLRPALRVALVPIVNTLKRPPPPSRL